MAPPTAPLVRFLDLARESIALRSELHAALDRIIDSGVFLFGEEVEQLESEVARALQVGEGVGAASGTVALQIMLLAHGIGPGDEVITTPASFFATAKAIAQVGARPVFADIDPDDYQLNPSRVQDCLSPRTRAILVVHLYGRPAPVLELREIADRAGILLREDVAQAFGATAHGRPIGSFGDSAALSFYPTKNLGAMGDAGMIVTKSAKVADRCRSIRFLGYSGERDHFGPVGVSGRMDEVQAAFLRAKLGRVQQWNQDRQRLAARYDELLPTELVRPGARPEYQDVRHLYVVRCQQRDALARWLMERGIESQIHYRVPLHLQSLWHADQETLPVAESWARTVLSLPLNPWLQQHEQDLVIEGVATFAERRI